MITAIYCRATGPAGRDQRVLVLWRPPTAMINGFCCRCEVQQIPLIMRDRAGPA